MQTIMAFFYNFFDHFLCIFLISLVVFAFQINSDVASLCTTLGILFMGIYGVLVNFKLGYVAIILALIAIILNLMF